MMPLGWNIAAVLTRKLGHRYVQLQKRQYEDRGRRQLSTRQGERLPRKLNLLRILISEF
jgi:hypothetical protein